MKETSLPSAQLFCVIAVKRWARNSHRRAESPPEGAHLPKCDRWAVCPSHQRWPAEKLLGISPSAPGPCCPWDGAAQTAPHQPRDRADPAAPLGPPSSPHQGCRPPPRQHPALGNSWLMENPSNGGAGGEKGINPILQLRWVPHLYDVFVSRSALGGVRDVDHGSVLLHGNHLDWHRHHSAREDGCVEDLCVLCAHTNTGCVSEELNTARMSQGSWQWQAQGWDPPSHTPFKLPAMF